jgi:hypothetical protein
MHVIDQDDLMLFIEPINLPSDTPVVDELTKKMVVALYWSKNGIIVKGRIIPGGYRGVHVCSCGAVSSNQDHLLLVQDPIRLTNSLASHYLAWHRDEIPESELKKVRLLKEPSFSYRLDMNDIANPARATT